MDYYIANPRFLPEKLFAGQFSEKFLYLPVGAPFTVSDHAPAVNELPALRNGFLTWGSFNRPNKISHQVIELWAQALLAVPGSRLVLGAMFGDDDSERLSTWFEMHGIERQRLDFHVRCSMDQYLAHHHQVDICLDTFPYNGGTTTFHAMSMGVPTLSLSGQTPAGRSSASILGNAGLQDFVVDSPSQFIDTARYWSLHFDELAALRRELRERLQSAALGESSVLTSSLALGLRAAWRRWCADAAPSHIYSEITGTQNGKRGTP
jgi:predicted O-linked N-acetylglucosamine transferase (SPINDLY family)